MLILTDSNWLRYLPVSRLQLIQIKLLPNIKQNTKPGLAPVYQTNFFGLLGLIPPAMMGTLMQVFWIVTHLIRFVEYHAGADLGGYLDIETVRNTVGLVTQEQRWLSSKPSTTEEIELAQRLYTLCDTITLVRWASYQEAVLAPTTAERYVETAQQLMLRQDDFTYSVTAIILDYIWTTLCPSFHERIRKRHEKEVKKISSSGAMLHLRRKRDERLVAVDRMDID